MTFAGSASHKTASSVPSLPRQLGYAGLLPQVVVVIVLASGSTYWRFAALALGYAYAALIFSFLGGMWWGLAARDVQRAPAWLWLAAIAPSLIALATFVPWTFGAEWPGPSLVALGICLIFSLFVDRQLMRDHFAPPWWMGLRVPLSIGLGILTITTAVLS